jgi:hypothetical protein
LHYSALFVPAWESDIKKFVMVITTKQLIQNLVDQAKTSGQPTFFHTDATYRLISDGFLLLTLSTEDPQHHARLIAVAVTIHEDTFAYSFLFKTIQDFVRTNHEYEWKPKFCLSDGADSIKAALKQIFPGIKHLLCYFHLKKAVKRYIRGFKGYDDRKCLLDHEPFILYGITLMHKCLKYEQFSKLWSLIQVDWIKNLRLPQVFIDYFNEQYINHDQIWFVGGSFIGKDINFNSYLSFVYFCFVLSYQAKALQTILLKACMLISREHTLRIPS